MEKTGTKLVQRWKGLPKAPFQEVTNLNFGAHSANWLFVNNLEHCLDFLDDQRLCVAGRWDPAVLSPTEVLGTAFSLLQLLSREERTQIAGVNLVLNAQGFSFKHLRSITHYYCNELCDTFPGILV